MHALKIMRVAWHTAEHESVMSLDDHVRVSSGGMRRALTVVPSAASDLNTLAPGPTFRGGNLLALITSCVDCG